jgi:hypothetical protein
MHPNEIVVRDRIERLLAEADQARLANMAGRTSAAQLPGRPIRRLGRLFISIGVAMQGAAPCPDEPSAAARM